MQFTEAGWQYLLDAQTVKQAIQTEYRTTLGEPAWEGLNAALEKLLDQHGPDELE